MTKKILVIVALIFLLPSFASAWYLNAKTSPTTGQGTISPSGNQTYPAGVNSGEYTVSPAPGYAVSRVTLDGVQIQPNANGKYVAPYIASKTYRYIVAYFIGGTVNITTQITSGSGAIREDTFESLINIPAGSNRQLLVIPNPGYTIASITAAGATSIIDNLDGTKTVTYNNLRANQTVSASFSLVPAVTVSAGSNVTANGEGAEFAATLYGSATSNQGAITYAWSGTGLSFGTPAAAITTVYAATPGIYPATLTVTSGATVKQDSATVTVLDRTEYLESFCTSCHSGNTPQVVTDYDASGHKAKQVSCQDCHTSTPHTEVKAACVDCHTPGNPYGLPWPPVGMDFHNDYTGTNLCTNCHNLHNPAVVTGMAGAPHYNNITSGMYPASYMTSRAACADCHYNSTTNASHRQEWNKSGHAATTDRPWIVEDFKTMSGCVQCHTTTGFIAYSTGKVTAAWGVASDKTKEVLRCNGCHKDVQNGIVRTVAPVRPYADDPYINRDLGKSNICMSCHSGVRNGASITVQLDSLADFTNLPFIDPHNHASGGNLHGKSGYHFPGATYAFYSTNSHRKIGIAGFSGSGTSGPCISCHRNDTNSHTNKSLINTLCGNCHGASFTVEQLYVDKQGYTNALDTLNAMLAAKGHPYSPTPPSFSNNNWGVGQEGANTLGAAFNYVMLRYDNGAYAHNSAYAKQLIFDSIDYLYNGSITGSIEEALSYLVANDKITQEAANSVKSYKAEINCTICHTYSSGNHPAHLESGFGCVDCHRATASSNTTIVPGNTTHVNGVPDVVAGPGRTFGYSDGTCSSISCHNNGTATWGGTLGCDGCHDAPPATASHLKHYGGTIAQAGYGNTGSAQDITPNATVYLMNCGNCHPMGKAMHGNGTVDIELYNPLAPAGSLKALNPASAAYVAGGAQFTDSRGLPYTNGTCSNVYCHSYNNWTTTAAIPESDPDWQAKVVITRIYKAITWGSASLACSGCHGNPTQTSSPANDGGAGDSHSWIDPYGYQNLHTWNMGYAPISCRYCHNDTVNQLNTYTEDGMGVRTLSNVPIGNFSKHVNGSNDVAFDRQNPFVYSSYGSGSIPMSLANATYDPATKNCSNVSCHIQQTTVKWGTPYRWYTNECDICHGYSN